VLANEIFGHGPRVVVERVIGGAHIGELGVAASVDDDPARKDRVFRRHRAERTVRVPELVAEVEQAAAVVARHRLMVLTEVRDVVHQRTEPLLVILGYGAAGRILDLAEISGEVDLLLVGDFLVMEDQYRIAIHPLVDCGDLAARQRAAQIDPADLADKDRMDLADRKSHRRLSCCLKDSQTIRRRHPSVM
jgi:hypothetical protein